MGTAKQGDRRRRGIEKWALEIFRVRKVDEVDLRGSCSAPDTLPEDATKTKWNGSIATIDVSTSRSLDTESGIIKIATHPLSLHAIDSTPLILLDSNGEQQPHLENTCLMAYGGAAGLLRIHTIDILKEIVGLDS